MASASSQNPFPDDGSPREIKRHSDTFLRNFAISRADIAPGQPKLKMTQFSHSNFKGAADHITETGKLVVPDDNFSRDQFSKVVCSGFQHEELQCYTFIENALEVHPLIFDIDFLCRKKPPAMFNEDFWEEMANIVLDVLDKDHKKMEFDVCVFTSHGHHSEKSQYKFSYHIYFQWRASEVSGGKVFGVDKLVMSQIRLYILQKIYERIFEEDEYFSMIYDKLYEYCSTDFNKVIDKTPCSMPVASFRLPFCDKMKSASDGRKTKQLEGRPVIPEVCMPFRYEVEEKFEKYFWYLARCEAKFRTTTLFVKTKSIKMNQNA